MVVDDARRYLLRDLAASDIDPRVREAIAATDRRDFVPAELRDEAWDDRALPIGNGQTISQPRLVAHMCELLDLEGHERILDVGTGSGWHAAVLSRLAARVVSIERDPALAARARAALADRANVRVITGDGAQGYAPQAPYDAINVAAAAGEIPPALEEQLADGGRLVLPVEDGRAQHLVLVRRLGERLERERVMPVRFVPLV